MKKIGLFTFSILALSGIQMALMPSAAAQSVYQAQNQLLDFYPQQQTGVLSLSGLHTEPKIKREVGQLVVTLPNHAFDAHSVQNLEVADLGTPVRHIRTHRVGKDTKIVVKTQGSWSASRKQQGDKWLIEITPQATEWAADGINQHNKSYHGKRISLDFQDVEVRTILQILSKESGLNIIASDSVNGKITLSLNDVPWDQALDLILQIRNLDMRKQGNIINVAPRDELLARDKNLLQTQNEINDLGPLVSQTFRLKYRDVEELRKVLHIDVATAGNGNRGGLLSARGSVLADPASNTLIVTDTQAIVKKVQKLIERIDVAAAQVMIEARIVEASDGVSRDLGVRFGMSGVTAKSAWGANLTSAQSNRAAYHAYQNGTATQVNYAINPNINLPVAAATSSIALIRSLSSGALGLELAAQQAENKAKIISSPRVLTQDRKEAVIESGTEIPYEEATSSGATSVSFKKAVLGLTVTPNITPDGQIIMAIKVNKDTVDPSCNASEPCINTQRLQTNAMVEDGGTLVLGGIYEENNLNAEQKVPLLGDIPVIGHLFKYKMRSQGKKELLIFITPKIVGNTHLPQ